MLNFLPQKNKKQIIFEYLLRITVFLLLFIFGSSLILISLFFPSFFFVKYKNDTVNSQLELVKQKNISKGEDPIVSINNVNILSVALAGDANSALSYSEIIKKIVSLKNDGIKISSIAISKENSTGIKNVLINGIADTRDSLSLYENNIKTDGYFDSVIFPVSNFIKSSNAEFSITLTYRNK